MRKTKSSGGYPRQLRIIGGQWRGRHLPVAEVEGLRPTPNRVRETLFNWLRPWLPGARCLDVTAGTGSLCLEALSQGAERVTMVEKSKIVAEVLRQNVERLGAGSRARVVEADALEFLQDKPESFDIIFLDPPFQSNLIGRCAQLIEQAGWIKPGGLIYIEAPSRIKDLPLPPAWHVIRSKVAGQVGYHLARKT